MKTKTGLLLLAGAAALTTIPSVSSSISTPARQQFQLTTGQKEFIRQFDEAVGTKILPVASSAAAVPIFKAASFVETLPCKEKQYLPFEVMNHNN